MTKTNFTLLVDDVLNDFECKLTGLDYNEDGICKVSFEYSVFEDYFYAAYRFMNRARLRLIIMDKIDLLEPIDSDFDEWF